MFTGIVEEQGRVAEFNQGAGGWRLVVEARAAAEGVATGDSIAVNGCCLTVARHEGGRLTFDVLEETRRLTNFSRLGAGAGVNLERSLRFGGSLGGHFVTGHIDGLGEVDVHEARGADHFMRIRAPAAGRRYLAFKGSVAIDGVSLTIAEVGPEDFAVWLIPHTLSATNLGRKTRGDWVNLEFDLLGKYVEKLLESRA